MASTPTGSSDDLYFITGASMVSSVSVKRVTVTTPSRLRTLERGGTSVFSLRPLASGRPGFASRHVNPGKPPLSPSLAFLALCHAAGDPGGQNGEAFGSGPCPCPPFADRSPLRLPVRMFTVHPRSGQPQDGDLQKSLPPGLSCVAEGPRPVRLLCGRGPRG